MGDLVVPMDWGYKREEHKSNPVDWEGINSIIKSDVTVEKALSAYLPGAKFGRYRRMPCPIHHGEDDNFSFGDTWYKCWSCGAVGDVISLTMELLKCDYMGAIRRLNDDFNLRLPLTSRLTDEERKQTQLRIEESAKRVAEQNARREAYEAKYDHLMGAWVAGDILSRSENPEERAEGKAAMTIYSYLLDGLGDFCE